MTLRNPVDDDRLKLFPKEKHREYLRQCDMRDGGCNDAELVAEMRREGTLKVLDPSKYEEGNGRPKVRLGNQSEAEITEGYGLKRGDTVRVTTNWPWAMEEEEVILWSIDKDGRYIRTISGRTFTTANVVNWRLLLGLK